MPIYIYKGYDIVSGGNRKGKIEAESLRVARQKLKTKDKIIASELKEELVVKKGEQRSSFFTNNKVSLADLAIMTRQFATLQRAHVPLDDSLRALTSQVESLVLRNTLSALKDAVSEGKSLAEAMGQFPHIFDRLYTNMIRAGEQSGNLDLVLERLSEFLEYQVAIRGKIFSALSYPLIMILASAGIICYLFISVVPKLEKVFVSMKVTLPWYSAALLNFSKFLQNQWLLVSLFSAGLFFIIRAWSRTKKGSLKVNRWSLTLPIFGPIVLRVNVSKFTKTLSTLLGSGVPIITALEITKNTIGNQIISAVVDDAKKAVQEGESLAAAIERSGEFPSLVVHMVRTGEKTGELEKMLSHVADAYDAEVERKIDSLISMIEPLMIIVMGGIVVLVVLAMLVPMLAVMNQVR